MSTPSPTTTVVGDIIPSMSQLEKDVEGEAVQAVKAERTEEEEPYTTFSPNMKLFIVSTVSMAGFFSPFTINIFIPALPQISESLHVSESAVNAAVTVYMVAQGLSPVIWAPLSDTFGRRPIYLITFLIFFAANFGLSFTNTYWLLLVLRIFQATGACSAIAIGAGTIADVTERKERGGYMGYYAFAQYTGPAIGPVLGGILSQRWDYHATFFFLTALSGLVLIFMGFFLVETLRTLVGNGSLAPRGIYRSILSPSTKKQDSKEISMKNPFKGKHDFGFMRPFKVFARPETSLAVLSFSLVYATYYLSAGSLSYLLSQEYGYDVIIIGVCYLPSGVGCAIGTVLGGKILDWDYQRALKKKPDANVKITRVRLQSAWIYMPGYSLSLLAYGWCIRAHTNIVAPLVFQFIVGMFSTMYFTNINTLIVDLYPGKAASATAAVNLGRCLMGAVAVAVVQPMLEGIGAGWTFTIGALLVICFCTVSQTLLYMYGEAWSEK